MSDQERTSQLSALFDNELAPPQAEMVIRRALKDPALRQRWERYALIGACVRGEPLAESARLGSIADRVQLRLAAEPDHAATDVAAPAGQRDVRRQAWMGRGVLGGAIAAGVAVLSVFLVRSIGPVDGGPETLMAAAGEPVAAAGPAPFDAAADLDPGYTTPVDNSPAAQRLSAPLVNYVVAHSEVAASAVRFSPLYSVMDGSYDPTLGAVEMTAAEIGARRGR